MNARTIVFLVGLSGVFFPVERSLSGVPEAYDLAVPASVLDSLEVVTDGSGDDLNGDGVPDNSLGTILGSLEPLIGDINEIIRESIESGDLLLGAAWPDLPISIPDSNDVTTDFFLLEDEDGNPMTRERFLVRRDSFVEGTGTPRFRVTGGEVAARQWAAGPVEFPLELPLAGLRLDLIIKRASVRGTLSAVGDGIAVANGTLSGVVSLADFFAAINAFLGSEACGCLRLRGPLLVLDEGTGAWSCSNTFDDMCGRNDPCSTIASLCSLALGIFLNNADIDTDGDGEPDSLSAFLRVRLSGAKLVGLAGPADCNENGVPDADDIASGRSADEDGNGIPDECVPPVTGTPFHRGDPNDDGNFDLSDGVAIFGFLFLGNEAPGCLEAADVNNSGTVDISDGISILNHLFLGGPPPADPGPPGRPCGVDPDEPGSPADTGCEAYENC